MYIDYITREHSLNTGSRVTTMQALNEIP